MIHVTQASLVACLEQLHQSINQDKENGGRRRERVGGAGGGENSGNRRRESETSEWGGSAYEV